jgi:hypothetical protein
VLTLPESGSVLVLDDILPVPFLGQGIAWDRTDKGILYGIIKKDKHIVKTKMIEEE